MMSPLSCLVAMGGIRELLDGKIWDLSFRWEWDGNKVIEMGGNWYKNLFPHTSSAYCCVIGQMK